MIRALLSWILLLALFPSIPESDLELLRSKVLSEMMQPSVDSKLINRLTGSIREDGTWPGIDYKDVSRTGFQHSRHLDNMVALSRAYKKSGSEFKGDEKLRKVINSSLDYWLANDFICDNWWNNQIGTPDQFVKILMIMDKDLSADQIQKSLTIAYRANLTASGARPSGDRIKIAGILAKNALFQRNDSLFDETIKVIAGEVKFSTGRGMQYDYSFHHREDRVTSTLSYGMGYADAFAEWAALVSGTQYSFPESALNLLIDYYLDGICQTMVYGKYPDPGAENRSISRRGSLHAVGSSTPERLLKASDYRKDELRKIVKIRNGESKSDLSGVRFYWDSEYLSVQQPDYFTSVRMFSSRNNNMEMPYNSEGLMNHHYADGSNFISRTGDEYYDIYPVFDFQKIPGTTIVQKAELPSETQIQKPGLTEFAGAVTDGNSGAAVFDFKSPHDPLAAKKAWFFFDRIYACLGNSISSSASGEVLTTINQTLLRGVVIVNREGTKSVVPEGVVKYEDLKWALHDSIGYIFPEKAKLTLSNKSETGNWYRINNQSDSPKDEVSAKIFKLWFDHGKHPENGSYEYFVMPAAAETDIDRFVKKPEITVLSNTSEIQAVMNFTTGLAQIVFYTSGELTLTDKIKIGIDSPGLVMISFTDSTVNEITVADPSRRLSRIHVSVNAMLKAEGNYFRITCDSISKVSEISIDLPQGVYAGKSVKIFTGKKEKIVLNESSDNESVVSKFLIEKVWSGHPVGFSLLTKGKRQYIAFYNSERRMVAGQRNLSEDKFNLHVLPATTREKTEGTSTVLGWDSHNYVTLAVDNEGYIHLSGNMHVNPLTYFRSTKPEDITSLVQVMEMTGKDEKRCTYPVFMTTREGDLLFHYRDGSSGNGNEIYNIYSCATKKWTRLLDTPLTDGEGLMNAYQTQPILMSDNWYHVWWVWRDTPDCSTNHDLSYIKSPNLKNWYDGFGKPIELPAKLSKKSVIVDPVPVKGGIINLAAKLCLDANNKPHFVYHKYGSDGNIQLFVAGIENGKWINSCITDWDYRWNFSGGGSINFEVRLNDFTRRDDGLYEVNFWHIKYGDGTILLDKEFRPIGKVLKAESSRALFTKEGSFPGLQIRTAGDSGRSSEPGIKYMLKWESLPANRDKPYSEPWPSPANLYIMKISAR